MEGEGFQQDAFSAEKKERNGRRERESGEGMGEDVERSGEGMEEGERGVGNGGGEVWRACEVWDWSLQNPHPRCCK